MAKLQVYCGQCRHFQPTSTGALGKCRLNPPVLVQSAKRFKWIEVRNDDWCSHWQDANNTTDKPFEIVIVDPQNPNIESEQ